MGIKGFLIDVYKNRAVKAVEFEDTLENIYELLDVELIDVVCLKVGGHVYDFIVDDEGLYHEGGVIPSVLSTDGKPMLVGNVLVVNSDEAGNFASLTDTEVDDLKMHVVAGWFGDDPVLVPILKGADYA